MASSVSIVDSFVMVRGSGACRMSAASWLTFRYPLPKRFASAARGGVATAKYEGADLDSAEPAAGRLQAQGNRPAGDMGCGHAGARLAHQQVGGSGWR